MLMHRPQTPQPGFGSITLLQKFTPPFQNPGSAPEYTRLFALCYQMYLFIISNFVLVTSFLIIFLSLDSFTFFGLDLK